MLTVLVQTITLDFVCAIKACCLVLLPLCASLNSNVFYRKQFQLLQSFAILHYKMFGGKFQKLYQET